MKTSRIDPSSCQPPRAGRLRATALALCPWLVGACSFEAAKEVRWDTAQNTTPIGHELVLYDFDPETTPPVPLPKGLVRGQAVMAVTVEPAIDVTFSDGSVERRSDPTAPKFVRRVTAADATITATAFLGDRSRQLPSVTSRKTGEFALDLGSIREDAIAMADRIESVRVEIACRTEPGCLRTIAVPISCFYWEDK